MLLKRSERVLGSQGFVTAIGVALISIVAVVAYLVAFDPLKKTVAYCAVMPDAVGLYTGNQVTMLGIPVGTVRAVRPQGGGVRVEFDIDAARKLHGDVVATTVSDTLVADRQLEVLGDSKSQTDWNPGNCITKTFTPKSITQTLQAFTGLADQLTGNGNPADATRVKDAVAAFQAATSGSGQKLNQLIQDLGTALRQPDAAIGHMGALIDSFSSIVGSISINWDDIKSTLLQTGPGITLVNEIWGTTVQLLDSLLVVFPMLNDISRKYGRDILNGLDELMPYMKLLSANLSTLQKVIDMIPAISDAFRNAIDPETGKARLTYAAPKVQLPQENAEQICAAVNTVMPGRCRTAANGLANADLVPLVLGLAGAR
ncbi:MlaD family protein [Nocardia sp. NPDC051030]|uniref:MlaD family protein n=1 Tax=Nocardia sp. NPDC051030 TaxID=3155162 RepID=UPI00341C6A0E